MFSGHLADVFVPKEDARASPVVWHMIMVLWRGTWALASD